jgi:hypothetical protein
MRTRAIAVVIFLVVLAAALAAVKTGFGHVHPLFGFSSGA